MWVMEAVEALALVSGYVDEELLVKNKYLAVENRILKSKQKIKMVGLIAGRV